MTLLDRLVASAGRRTRWARVELALHRVDADALGDRLVGAGRVDLVGGLAVEPVVGAAQAEALRGDDADVVGREALAEQAGVERVDRLVGQVGHALVALAVGLARLLDAASSTSSCVGDEVHLHLVDDVAEHRRGCGRGGSRRSARRRKPLSTVLLLTRIQAMSRWPMCWMPSSAVDEVVDLALEDRLEVVLHLAAGDLDHDAQRHGAALLARRRGRGRRRSILPSSTSSRPAHAQVLEGRAALAAELDAHVVLADALALEGRCRRGRGSAPW